MISKSLYRLLDLSLWCLGDTITDIRDNVSTFGDNAKYNYKDLLVAKMLYEADLGNLFPNPENVTDSTFMNIYISYFDKINFDISKSARASKTIKNKSVIDSNTILKCFLHTRNIDVLVVWIIDILCEIANEYTEDGYNVPEHLSKTINSLKKKYRTNYSNGIFQLPAWIQTQECVNDGYSIYHLHTGKRSNW